ncbi:MAG: RdgB/HAM1 family non-canonical purine NTP pyrophosphatase [Chloroflexota bacterium]
MIVATGNPGKLAELRELLDGQGLELVAWTEEVEESGASYAENAILKAEAAARATGSPALGDDSGLEVAALGGAPGLHSKRVGATQAERNQALWQRLAGVPRPWPATFVAVLALAVPGRPPRLFVGRAEGEVLPAAPGEGGFGYDPVFLVPELGLTFAQLGRSEKHRLSHRGRAAAALVESGVLSSIE